MNIWEDECLTFIHDLILILVVAIFQCAAGQLEIGNQEDEFMCGTCNRVLRSIDFFTAASLEAVTEHEGEGKSSNNSGNTSKQEKARQQQEQQDKQAEKWITSAKVRSLSISTL